MPLSQLQAAARPSGRSLLVEARASRGKAPAKPPAKPTKNSGKQQAVGKGGKKGGKPAGAKGSSGGVKDGAGKGLLLPGQAIAPRIFP